MKIAALCNRTAIALFSLLTLNSSLFTHLSAQSMAINPLGHAGNAAAVLDLSDASNAHLGLLLPNVSLSSVTDVVTVTSPPNGLIVYNTNPSTTGGFGVGFYYYSTASTQWLYVSNTGAPGVTTFSGGTTGITPSSAASGSVTLGGILNVTNGGSGLGTTPTNGQLLIGNGAGYTLGTISSTNSTIAITTGSGMIGLDLAQQGAITNQVLAWNGTQWAPQYLSSIGLQNLSEGTGMASFTYNGTSTAVVGLANTGVTANSYGDAANYPTFTVNAQGQLTAAGTIPMPATLPPSGTAGGDLGGTYPTPTVVWANGYSTYDGRYIKTGATAGGDLSGTYPNPTVSQINGSPLGTITGATSGQALVWNGTSWAPGTATIVSGQNLTPGTGISGSTYNGSAAVSDWSVLYGSTANTAVQGNTTFSVTAGTGISGGGSITEGAGGTLTLNNTGVLGVTGTSPISSSGGANPIISFPSWPADVTGVLTNNGTGTLTWGSSSSLGNITVTNTGGGLGITGSPVALGGTINIDPNITTDATLTGNGTTSTPLGLPSVITAGGPTGNSNTVPVITYDAFGRLTAVTTATITASSIGMQNLTEGTGITPFTYNGSSTATIELANTAVTANSYGDAANYGTFTVNAQGQLTAASQLPLPTTLPPTGLAAGDLSGTYPAPTVAQINGSPLGTTTGAISGQALVWTGTNWAPGTATSVSGQNLTPGTGISGSTYNGSAAVSDWSVLYGSTANTAVQGNTTFSVTAGTGISGGGSITEGAGGTLTLNNTGVLGVTGTSPISSSGGANPIISFPSWPADVTGVLTNNGTGTLTWGSSSSLGNITVTNTGGGLGITGSPVALGGTINIDPNITTDATLTGNGTTSTPLGLPSVITAGGPTGNSNTVPVITYDAFGRLTAVTTATITASSIGMQNLTEGTGITPFTYNGSSTATIGLANTAVTANSYGDAANYGTFTVNAQGQLTAASQLPLPTTLPPTGLAAGDLSGTYPAPTVAQINGSPLGTTTGAISGQALVWTGTNWAPGTATSVSGQNLTPGTGLSGSTYNGSTAVSDWSVLYGSTANTAVQGNTTFSVTAGTGISGGGSITEGTGGTLTLNNTGVLGVTGTSPISSSGGANPIISFPSWPANATGVLSNNGTGTLSWGALTLPNSLTQGTGITAFTFNGSAPATVNLASTTVTAGSYGNSSSYSTFTVNAQGQLTAAGTLPLPTSLPPNGTAGGDLGGTYPTPTVVWANGYSTYDTRYIKTGATAGGDLSGTYVNPTVSKLLGNAIPSNASGYLHNDGTGVLTWGSASSLGNITVTNTGGGLSITGSPVVLGGTIDIAPNIVTDATLTGKGTTATPLGLASVITAGGPVGSGNVVPVITYNAKGQLTVVSTATITASSIGMQNLTQGTGITAFSYNGSSAATVGLANTAVTAGNYGSATTVPTFTVNAQGQLTGAANVAITGLSTINSGTIGSVLSNLAANTPAWSTTPSTGAMLLGNSSGVATWLPDVASGSILVSGGVNTAPTYSTVAAVIGNGYILNQTSQQASSNFNISGTGTIGGLATLNAGVTETGGAASINASGANSTTIGNGTNALTENGNVTINASNGAATTNIGTGTTTGAVTIGNAANTVSILGGTFTVSGTSAINGATTLGTAGAPGSLSFNDNTTHTVNIKAPSAVTSYSLTLPSAQASAGQVLANDGTGVLSWATPNTGRLIGILVLKVTNATATTFAAGTNTILVELIGGGAAGGGCSTSSKYNGGGGGGSGAYCKGFVTGITSGTTYTVTIGAGGTASTGAGGAGTTTTFATTSPANTFTANGGSGGTNGAAGSTTVVAGGAGGTAGATGSLNYAGKAGSPGEAANNNNDGIGGAGGSGIFGGGGNETISGAAGITSAVGNAGAANSGGGGSGASNGTPAATVAGGAGGSGVVVIYEYN